MVGNIRVEERERAMAEPFGFKKDA